MTTQAPTLPTPSDTIHLQQIGETNAIVGAAIVPGCVLVWNFGYLSVVDSVRQASKCFVEVTLGSLEWTHRDGATLQRILSRTGKTYTRRIKNTRLVGYGMSESRTLAKQSEPESPAAPTLAKDALAFV